MPTLTENRWRGTWKAHSCWPVENWYEGLVRTVCISFQQCRITPILLARTVWLFFKWTWMLYLLFSFPLQLPMGSTFNKEGFSCLRHTSLQTSHTSTTTTQMNFFSLLIYSSTIAVVIVVHASVPLSIWSNKVLSENGVLWSHTCFVHHLWDLTSFC